MRVPISLLAVAFTSSLVAADPAPAKPSAPLSAAAHKTYDAQLGKGRALESAGKHIDAIAAFEAGLAVAPDDSTLLGEIGASAYLAKDLAKAESSTRKAIANASAPNVRGASLYNLGRIQEDRKDLPGAITSYSESIKARPNAVVRARLTKLAPKAAAAIDPYDKPAAFLGPYASIEVACKARKPAYHGDDDPDHCTCGAETTDKPVTLSAPYQQMQWFSHRCTGNDSLDADYMLGVKMAAGWYVAHVDRSAHGNHCMDGDYSVVDVKPAAVAPNAIVVRYRQTLECSNANGDGDTTETRQVVFGIGPSKQLAVTASMLQTRHSTETPNDRSKKTDSDIALDYAWAADGSFTVSGKAFGIDPTEAGGLLGKHLLAFP